MRPLLASALSFVLLTSSAGCVVLRGPKQKVQFSSTPTDASLAIDSRHYQTPAQVSLSRNKVHHVTVSAAGYRTVQFELKSRFDGLSLIDFLPPGGSLIFAADTLTGAGNVFTNRVTINLTTTTQPTTQPLVLLELNGKLVTQAEYDEAARQAALAETYRATHPAVRPGTFQGGGWTGGQWWRSKF